MSIAVTGATGQLGQLVLEELPGAIGLARDPGKVKGEARRADYDAPETLAPALKGVERLLLISSSEVGSRARQHKAVIDAAKAAGVGFIAYTSLLRADTSPMSLAGEHKATEEMLKASGIPFALLRNGWYSENHAMGLAGAVEAGVLAGAAGEGRISSAPRADFASAAARVIASGKPGVWELAGDTSYSLAELAALAAEVSGKPVVYRDMGEAEYAALLKGFGLPEGLALMLADSDARAAGGALFDDGEALSRLIGRPTLPMRETVKAALGKVPA